jgi:hypothetical protein
MNTYDVVIQLHHFHRHESSLDRILKKKMDEYSQAAAGGARFRWIHYFHTGDEITLRMQSTFDEDGVKGMVNNTLQLLSDFVVRSHSVSKATSH